jgi:GTP pyrophosphokinase
MASLPVEEESLSIVRIVQTLRQLAARAPERIIKSAWAQQTSQNSIFAAEVSIKAIDRHGLLRDISEVFSKLRINVVGVNTLVVKGWLVCSFQLKYIA